MKVNLPPLVLFLIFASLILHHRLANVNLWSPSAMTTTYGYQLPICRCIQPSILMVIFSTRNYYILDIIFILDYLTFLFFLFSNFAIKGKKNYVKETVTRISITSSFFFQRLYRNLFSHLYHVNPQFLNTYTYIYIYIYNKNDNVEVLFFLFYLFYILVIVTIMEGRGLNHSSIYKSNQTMLLNYRAFLTTNWNFKSLSI